MIGFNERRLTWPQTAPERYPAIPQARKILLLALSRRSLHVERDVRGPKSTKKGREKVGVNGREANLE